MDQDFITPEQKTFPALLSSQFAFLADWTRSVEYMCEDRTNLNVNEQSL